MILSDIIKKSNILIKTHAKTRWELLDELVDLITENREIDPADNAAIKRLLHERERSMSTGIGNGVAIPHCASGKFKETLIVMAINQKGIDFDAIDNMPVNIIILIMVPKNKLSQHIKTLANIAKLFSNEALRTALIASKTPEMAIKTIKQFEK